jgi:hypothetical protein
MKGQLKRRLCFTCGALVFGLLAVQSTCSAPSAFANSSRLECSKALTCPPVHTPPWQEPLLQAVPSALGGASVHIPVAGSQTPAALWHSPGAGQVTPTQGPAVDTGAVRPQRRLGLAAPCLEPCSVGQSNSPGRSTVHCCANTACACLPRRTGKPSSFKAQTRPNDDG